jgi:hypothetical protein
MLITIGQIQNLNESTCLEDCFRMIDIQRHLSVPGTAWEPPEYVVLFPLRRIITDRAHLKDSFR